MLPADSLLSTGCKVIVTDTDNTSNTLTVSVKGDVDGNGTISANDARQTLRAAVGLTKLSGMTLFAGDADRDDKISANDARLILRASVGLENLYVTI